MNNIANNINDLCGRIRSIEEFLSGATPSPINPTCINEIRDCPNENTFLRVQELGNPNVAHMQAGNGFYINGSFGGSIPIEGSGVRMLFYPGKAAFRAGSVGGTQWDNINVGNASFAEGQDTIASGAESHAEGLVTISSGQASHAEGYQTNAVANYSHSEGSNNTTASGLSSHAEGNGTLAASDSAHAEGFGTQALGLYSHAEGFSTIASNDESHAEGSQTVASGPASHAEGFHTTASNQTSHAEGSSTFATGFTSHAEGSGSHSTGTASHAEGNTTTASGDGSHSEGNNTNATAARSHAEGFSTIASGAQSHAEGDTTTASGTASHAQGTVTTADSDNCFTSGDHLITNSIAGLNLFGQFGTGYTNAQNSVSSSSIPAQIITIDPAYGIQLARGDTFNSGINGYGIGLAFGLRSGSATGHRPDIRGICGGWHTAMADYAEYFEWADGNPNNEDRIGYFVSLNQDKIEYANNASKIIGITSATSGFIGDSQDLGWESINLRDDFGRELTSDSYSSSINNYLIQNKIPITDALSAILKSNIDEFVKQDVLPFVPEKYRYDIFNLPATKINVINPLYDSSKPYVSRSLRKEWIPVGLMGKIFVRDDGTCKVGEKCTLLANGIATAGDQWFVLERKSANVIRILYR